MGGRRLLCGACALLFAIAAWVAPVLAEDVAVDEDLSDYELALQAMADGDEEMLKWLTILADTLEPDEDGATPPGSRSSAPAPCAAQALTDGAAGARRHGLVRGARLAVGRGDAGPAGGLPVRPPPARPPSCAAPTL